MVRRSKINPLVLLAISRQPADSTNEPPSTHVKRSTSVSRMVENMLLSGIMILGTFLRFYLLGYRGLWNDEVVSIPYWTGTITEVWHQVADMDIHPPFWFLMVNRFQWLLGESDFVFRLPSALAGILTLLAVYLLGKSVISKEVGLIAALLMGISSFHIYYSQEARMYALYGLFATVSLWLFWLAVEKTKARWWIAFALVSVLNVYTHYFSFIFLGIQFVFLILLILSWWLKLACSAKRRQKVYLDQTMSRSRSALLWMLVSLGVIGICFLPWIPALRQDIAPLADYGKVSAGSLAISAKSLPSYADLLLDFFAGYDDRLIPWYLFFFCSGSLSCLIRRKYRQLLLLLFVFAAPLAFNVLTGSMPHPRYFIFSFAPFLLIVSTGVEAIGASLSWLVGNAVLRLGFGEKPIVSPPVHLIYLPTLISLLALFGFVLLDADQLWRYYEYDMLGSWREIGEFLEGNIAPGDAIFTVRAVTLGRYLHYDSSISIFHGDQANSDFSLEALRLAYEQAPHVWIVMPTQAWNITAETKSEVLAWISTVPHARLEFLGWSFPCATVYFASSSALTQRDLLAVASSQLDMPHQPFANLSLASQLASAGMTEPAVDAYRKALDAGSVGRLRPGHLNRKSRADIHKSIGDMLLANGSYGQAIAEYNEAVALRASSFMLFHKMSEAYQQLGDTATASHYRSKAMHFIARPHLGDVLDLTPLANNYHGGVLLDKDGELGMFWEGTTQAPYDSPSGTYTFRVVARGQQGCGIWPTLSLYVDDGRIETRQITGAESRIYEFSQIVLDQEGPHVIGLGFSQPGECTQLGQDVNLFVRGIYLKRTGDAPAVKPVHNPEMRLDLAPLAGSYHGGVSLGDNGELEMWWAGSAAATYDIISGTHSLKAQARGQQGCGMWPILGLEVDGMELGVQQVNSAELRTYEFAPLVLDSDREHLIQVEFEQSAECSEKGQDVNLFIQALVLYRMNGE